MATSSDLVHKARQLAAARASDGVDALPDARFDVLWAAERAFIVLAREELGLPGAFQP